MRKSKKLHRLVFNELKIKDRQELLDIYFEYLQGNYITVVNRIKDYGEFEFFRDLRIYLRDNYRSENYKTVTYWFFYELYFEKLNIAI